MRKFVRSYDYVFYRVCICYHFNRQLPNFFFLILTHSLADGMLNFHSVLGLNYRIVPPFFIQNKSVFITIIQYLLSYTLPFSGPYKAYEEETHV